MLGLNDIKEELPWGYIFRTIQQNCKNSEWIDRVEEYDIYTEDCEINTFDGKVKIVGQFDGIEYEFWYDFKTQNIYDFMEV